MSIISKSTWFLCVITLALGCGTATPGPDTFVGTHIGARMNVPGQHHYHGAGGYQTSADWYQDYNGYNPNNYQNIVVGMMIQYQQDYLDAMKMKAEAALIKAKAKAELNEAKAEAIREATHELRRELAELRSDIKRIELLKQRAQIHARNLTRLSRKGEASADALTSIYFLMDTVGMQSAMLSALPAPKAGLDDLRSVGTYRIELNEEGQQVFRQAKVEAFAGGNMLQLLNHLRHKRLAVKLGSESHKAILGLGAMIQEQTAAWLETLKSEQDALRAKMEGRWEQLLGAISKIEES